MRWRRRRSREQDLDRELRAHLELEAEEQQDSGVSLDEARYAARRAFGNTTLVKEDTRAMWGWTSLERFGQDLRYGLRRMARSPVFTAIAVLTLALGIGANTAIFSVMNALLYRLLPVEQPSQLVQLRRAPAGQSAPPGGGFSYPAYERFRDGNEVFTGVLAASLTTLRAKLGAAETAEGQFVSGNFYSLLGVRPVLGRLISEEDDRLSEGGGAAVVVIGYGLWQRAFGGQSGVIGQQLLVEEKPLTIIGVTPRGFAGIQAGKPQDFAVPMAVERQLRKRSWLGRPYFNWLAVVGRLKPGVAPRSAEANLNVLFRQQQEAMAGRSGSRRGVPEEVVSVTPAGAGLASLRDRYSKPLYVLMTVVGIVLLIACVNLANLLLARTAARRREIAVRLALGASRTRLVLQLMTEGLVLSAAGGLLGLIFADWTSAFLVGFLRGVQLDVRPDATQLLFTAGVSLLASLVFGLVPALRAVHTDPGPGVKEGMMGSGDLRSGTKLRSGFVVAQVALSLILVLGAALFVRSLRSLQTLDPGFRREEVLLVNVNPGKAGFQDARLLAYYEQLLEQVRQLPVVRAASLSFLTPISGAQVDLSVSVEGRPASPGEGNVYINDVSGGYFETMGTPILLGRDFTARDSGPGSPKVLINEAMARYYFAGESPIGRRITVGKSEPAEIIGVVKDARYGSLRELPPRTVYQNCLQGSRLQGSFTLSVYLRSNASGVAGSVRSAVQSLKGAVPVSETTSFARQVEESLLQEQLMARLASMFGGLALLMTCMGLYGVLTYAVARRAREIGIRMALGARRKQVVALVVRDVLLQVLIGAAIGLPLAVALGRQVTSLLYGLKPNDPWMLGGATLLLFAVASIAGYLPASRAARVDPMVALRYE